MTRPDPHPQPAGPTPGPWTTETGLPYARKPRVYGADGSLVAEIGNAVVDQDRWEADAALIASAPDLLAKCAALEARCAALTAERDRLAGALAPFAEAACHIPADWSDARPAAHVNGDVRHPGTVTTLAVGQFRAALAALNNLNP